MFKVQFIDTFSKQQVYAISMQAKSKADAVNKAYSVAGALGYNFDCHIAHVATQF